MTETDRNRPRRLVVLGSTGTIGQQTLAVVQAHPDRFRVTGLAAASQAAELDEQVAIFRPRWCAVEHAAAVTANLRATAQRHGTTIMAGSGSAVELVRVADADVIVNGISGIAGIMPALAALERPVVLGMASKEPLVAAGMALRQAAAATGATIVSIDSEPAGVQQCLGSRDQSDLVTVYLTASGGPFWGRDPLTLAEVTPSEAVRHPRWRMGRKISVDSATMFNKGLEAIEISKLFGINLSQIKIVVHPQSIVHALVEWSDGSLLAQLAPTDMRLPISQALFWPEAAPSPSLRLGLSGLSLDFVEPDLRDWPCLRAALHAGNLGGTAPAVISAADEVLVHAFLAGAIAFDDIGLGLQSTLEAYAASRGEDACADHAEPAQVGVIMDADRWSRDITESWIRNNRATARRGPRTLGEDVSL